MKIFVTSVIMLLLITLTMISAGCNKVFRTGYLCQDSEILNSEGIVAGVLYRGTFIQSGKVTVWVDSEGTLYAMSDKRLDYGKLDDLSVLKYTGDVSGDMKEATLETNFPAEILTSYIDDALAESEDLYYEYCSTCHAAPDLSRKFNQQMKGVMHSMVTHSNVTEDEAAVLQRYISLKLGN